MNTQAKTFVGLRLVLIAIIFVSAMGTAIAGEFHWPSTVTPGPIPPLYVDDALGRPDGRMADFGAVSSSATFGEFVEVESFDTAALAELLGVSSEVIFAADFVAFEAWGEAFEASAWAFATAGVTHLVQAPEEALATGSIPGEAFANHFDFPYDDVNDVLQFILLDTGPVDATDPNLTVEVTRGYGPQGSPDIDALGVLEETEVAEVTGTWSQIKAMYK